MKCNVFSVFLAAAILLCLSLPVQGEEALDTAAIGSITVTLRVEGKIVPGGTLELYQVAQVRQENGNDLFEFTNPFRNCGLSLDDLQSPDLAKELLKYVEQCQKNGNSMVLCKETVNKNGKAVFQNLPVGLYLVVQRKAISGYKTILPFLVTIPIKMEGKYCYDVDAYPKGGESEILPTVDYYPPEGPDNKLPQTGQLKWPVPVLTCLGLGLCTAGWILSNRRKTDNES